MTETDWTAENIPDLSGKTFIVTGANSGLGLETSRVLASKGARVIMTARNLKKGQAALESIKKSYPEADLELKSLDLADLSSVRSFAADILAEEEQIDGLINNAGVMMIPRMETKDGFEMQFGTNHLGHFALTGLLINRLLENPTARIVNVSSLMHTRGEMNFDDLMGQENYDETAAYGQSKLANLLFTYELQRRLEAAGKDLLAVAVHPGYTDTNLQAVGPELSGSKFRAFIMSIANRLFAQDVEIGALPTLYAATAADVNPCDYIGPGGFNEMRGYPKKVSSNAASHNLQDAKKLWEISEELTGVTYSFN